VLELRYGFSANQDEVLGAASHDVDLVLVAVLWRSQI
jgi:hypothetical protein